MNQSKRMKLDETEALNDETIENSCESSSLSSGWQNLPDVIMRDILSMVGQNSLEDLHKSRQVSQSWNESLQLLSQKRRDTIKRKAESQTGEEWKLEYWPKLPEIVKAGELAHHGMLSSLKAMWLQDEDCQVLDLTSVPAEHLAALASCVKIWGAVVINKVKCDLVPIIVNSQCEVLSIFNQTLGTEETRALAWAMETGVEVVSLSEVILEDIMEITKYNGRGICRKLTLNLHGDDVEENKTKLRNWAQEIDWDVRSIDNELKFSRKDYPCPECQL